MPEPMSTALLIPIPAVLRNSRRVVVLGCMPTPPPSGPGTGVTANLTRTRGTLIAVTSASSVGYADERRHIAFDADLRG